MYKFVNSNGESYGNLYDKVNLTYSNLNFYVGDVITVEFYTYDGKRKQTDVLVVKNESCELFGIGFLSPTEKFVKVKSRASKWKEGDGFKGLKLVKGVE